MRIAVVSTTTYSTPPIGYGGEVFFWNLARGLCELGHTVTLYGAPGSLPPHENCRCSLRYIPGTYGELSIQASYSLVRKLYQEIMENDLVLDCEHYHLIAERAGWYDPEGQEKCVVLLNGATTHTPRCGPYNVVVGSHAWKEMLLKGRNEYYGTEFEKVYGGKIDPLYEEDILGVVYWATDTKFYTPGEKGDYLLWISHPAPYKGAEVAMEVAYRAGETLVLAPGIANSIHREYWEVLEKKVEEYKEKGLKVEVVHLPLDSTHHLRKRELIRRAKALLFPVLRHECFGLVVVEALACHTPVICSSMGALPEIVRDGVDGYLCRSVEEMVEKVKRLGELEYDWKWGEEQWHYLRAARDLLSLGGK